MTHTSDTHVHVAVSMDYIHENGDSRAMMIYFTKNKNDTLFISSAVSYTQYYFVHQKRFNFTVANAIWFDLMSQISAGERATHDTHRQ